MEVRRLLEIPMARLAAENARPENVAVLRRCVEGQSDALTDPPEFMKHDVRFHSELALATQNTVLSVLVQPLFTMLGASRPIVVSVPGKAQRSLDAHQRVLDAVERHDGDAAAEAMSEHLRQLALDRERARQMMLVADETEKAAV
jgi:DNA-binding FadR family transcriptional regulator